MKRPEINKIQSGTELKRWYWLKRELIGYCRQQQLPASGSKFEILDRIASALDNTKTNPPKWEPSKTRKSTFDWRNENLSPKTVITDNYQNTLNVRRFFIEHCGERFRFSIPLIRFMKTNVGSTLQDAIGEWHRLQELRKNKNFKSEIPEGNQYNKYLRDFFEDNPGMTMEQARKCWKLKRSLPLGRHVYEKTDLDLK